MLLNIQRIEFIIRILATFEQFLITSHKVKHLLACILIHQCDFHAVIRVMRHHKRLTGQCQSHLGHSENKQMRGRARTIGQILPFILIVQRHQLFATFKIRQKITCDILIKIEGHRFVAHAILHPQSLSLHQ